MTKVIAVVNQKGGVAKTTSTVHLGVAIAEMGKKVLLVDLDSQVYIVEEFMRVWKLYRHSYIRSEILNRIGIKKS